MIAERTPEENMKYWLDVLVNPSHPHWKKFSNGFTRQEKEDYINRMIAMNEKDIELKSKQQIAA